MPTAIRKSRYRTMNRGLIAEFLFSRQGVETPAAGILEYGPPGYPPVGFPLALRHQWLRLSYLTYITNPI
jgi:hypothetical protein